MEAQTDLLEDIHQEIFYEPVSAGIRFANYLVDMVILYILLVALLLVLRNYLPMENTGFSYLVTYLLLVIYYTVMEGVTKGKTIGKLVTGTVAIRADGALFTFYDAMVRSLCRIVPFEPLTTFNGNPWHDKWTNTKVVKVRR